MKQAFARTENGLRTSIKLRHHTIFADEPLQDGGTDTAPTPMEMLAGALGACMVVTAELYARRKKWPLTEVTVSVSLERFKKEDYPAYTGEVGYVNEVRYEINFGALLTEEQKVRLLEIAKKCPVHRTLEYPTFFVEGLREEPIKET